MPSTRSQGPQQSCRHCCNLFSARGLSAHERSCFQNTERTVNTRPTINRMAFPTLQSFFDDPCRAMCQILALYILACCFKEACVGGTTLVMTQAFGGGADFLESGLVSL